MDINYFFGSDFTAFGAEPLRSSVPLQWALDLMCEKLQGVSNFLFFSLRVPASESSFLIIYLYLCLLSLVLVYPPFAAVI